MRKSCTERLNGNRKCGIIDLAITWLRLNRRTLLNPT